MAASRRSRTSRTSRPGRRRRPPLCRRLRRAFLRRPRPGCAARRWAARSRSASTTAAVPEYAACRRGPHAWALGRFVLPLSRREQFERHAPQEAWRLTVLAGPDLEAEMSELSELRRRRPETVVEAVEMKVAGEAEIE